MLIFSGNDLIENGHYAQKEIHQEVKRLQDIWKQLQDTSSLKRDRLNEAYQVNVSKFLMVDILNAEIKFALKTMHSMTWIQHYKAVFLSHS